MPVTCDQFGKALIASGLMTADEVKALWAALPAAERPKDGPAFAALLTKRGQLNEFQSQELLSGRNTPLLLNQYLILAKIGAGGMGQVFKAQHRKMKRLVAIKLLPSAMTKDEAAISRFQREVEAAAKLSHPNIVAASDADECRGMHYLVMEYVEGQDLSALVKSRGPLPVNEAVNYILQAARGLAFAHGEGVVHRDIKPANLLLDKKGVVKILDMGLARFDQSADAADHQLTNTGAVMGTIDYMSPEQATDTHAADARSDIYSLGCSLYRLLTGENVYAGDTVVKKMLAHMNSPVPLLTAKRSEVPAEIDRIFQKMVAKLPEDRYQQTSELVADLEAWSAPGSSTSVSTGSLTAPDDKLTNFFHSLQTAGNTAAKATPVQAANSSTKLGSERTAAHAGPEIGTDPKSEIRVSHQPATAARASKRKGPPKNVLIAAGGAGALLVVLLGVWVIVRDKDGKEVAKVQVSQGGTVNVKEVKQSPFAKPSKESVTLKTTATPKTAVPIPPTTPPTPFQQNMPTTPVTGAPTAPPASPAAVTTTIPAEALAFGGHRYLLVNSFGTWSEAKAKAEAMGGHLVTINSQAERDWILEKVWRTRPEQGNAGTRIFLGGFTTGDQGGWSWITGEPFDPSLWLGPVVKEPGFALAWASDTSWNTPLPDNIQNRYIYLLVEWDTLGSTALPTGAPATTASDTPQPAPQATASIPQTIPPAAPSTPVATVTPTTTNSRLSLPPTAALAQAEKLLKDLHKADLAQAKQPAEKAFLAGKFIKQADAAANDTASKYVLLQESQRLATEAADLLLLHRAIRALASTFRVDAHEMLAAALETMAQKPRQAPQQKELAEAALAPIDELEANARFELAERFQTIALAAAKKSKDAAWTKIVVDRGKSLADSKQQSEAAKKSAALLTETPGDAAQNLSYGKYLCFVNEEWEAGFVRLAKGSDEKLAELAKLSLAKPNLAAAQAELGDAWWTAAESANAARKTAFQNGARYWYLKAVNDLSGLAKSRVEQRLRSLPMGSTKPLKTVGALEFAKGDVVETDPIPKLSTVVRTCEVWCTPSGPGFVLGGPLGGLSIQGDKFEFYTFHGSATSEPLFKPNQRIHLAGVNDGNQRRLYLDGALVAVTNDAGGVDPNPQNAPLQLGGFTGRMEAVRVSRVARYDRDFIPPARFVADDETVALYRFDEGSSDMLGDSSVNNLHAKIKGAKWGRTDRWTPLLPALPVANPPSTPPAR